MDEPSLLSGNRQSIKRARLDRGLLSSLLFSAQNFLSWLMLLTGAAGIALIEARALSDSLRDTLESRPVLLVLAAVVVLASAVLTTPLGRPLTRRLRLAEAGADLNLAKFLFLTVELGLLVLIMRLFELESTSFYENIAILTWCGFLVNYFLPHGSRLPFFIILSSIGIVSILGVVNGTWLIGLGLVLIGITYLPIAFRSRVVLLCAAGLLLALVRVNLIPAPWSVIVLPVLGSIFMFRMIVYLYDLKHAKTPPGLLHTLAYFFLLPNVTFPLFPVVDFSTFRRTYYHGDEHETYQRGVHWMLRGIVYLVLYRFVYYYLVIGPGDVTNAGDLLRYLASNYLLYLRVIGEFDVIVGILHLFGFNLPEPNILNFFASSVSGLWRRANIYWKDFMLKVFYYPSYFELRRFGNTTALALATMLVFVVTWLLHAYQWFWILGSFPITAPDTLFWALFGVLMVGNVLYENRAGRKRNSKASGWDGREFGIRILKTVGIFALISALWSLWTSQSIEAWLDLWPMALVWPAFDWRTVAGVIAGGLVFLAIYVGVAIEWKAGQREQSGRAFFQRSALTAALILLVYVLNNPLVFERLGGRAGMLIADLQVNRLNQLDANNLTRGYYENLLSVNGTNSQLWQVYMQKPLNADDDTRTADLRAIFTDGFIKEEFRPNIAIMFHGAPLHTNRWGMRDRDYEKQKPANTYRIAIFGGSYVMGTGVGDDQTFENLVEDRLNRQDAGKTFAKYEILNFAFGGYSIFQDMEELKGKAVSFSPDTALLVANPSDGEFLSNHLAERITSGAQVPYPFLMELAQKAGVTREMPRAEAEKRLKPFQAQMLEWSYQQIVKICRENGIRPVWLYLTMPGSNSRLADPLNSEELARNAGFFLINMSGIYEGQDTSAITLSGYDDHPNAEGHRLIADQLYRVLHETNVWSALGLGAGSGAQIAPTMQASKN